MTYLVIIANNVPKHSNKGLEALLQMWNNDSRGGFTEEWWLKLFPDTLTILDNMIERKLCEPLIIVTPTFYHSDEDKHTQDEDRCENFKNELRKDLIPAVESKYSTYAAPSVSCASDIL